jgi:hypothetical protein
MHPKRIARTVIAFAFGVATAAAVAAADWSTSPAVVPNADRERVIEQPQPAPPHPGGHSAVRANPNQQPLASALPVIVRTTAAKTGQAILSHVARRDNHRKRDVQMTTFLDTETPLDQLDRENCASSPAVHVVDLDAFRATTSTRPASAGR